MVSNYDSLNREKGDVVCGCNLQDNNSDNVYVEGIYDDNVSKLTRVGDMQIIRNWTVSRLYCLSARIRYLKKMRFIVITTGRHTSSTVHVRLCLHAFVVNGRGAFFM